VALDELQRRVLAVALAQQRQSWEQGVLAHALLDLGEPQLVRLLAHDAVVRQTPDGRLADVNDSGAVNGAAAAEAVRAVALGLAGAPADPDAARALERQLTWLDRTAPRADDGTLFHIAGTREVWVDTVYMVVPLLVLTGRVPAAAAQLAGHRARLYDERAGLYAHRWDDATGTPVRGAFWGSGSGWEAAGLARAVRHLDALPPATAGSAEDGVRADFRATATAHARDVVDACLRHRTATGRFHDVLDDPATFEEVTLAAMLASAVATGVADGWLPARYATTANSLAATVRTHVDADGFLRPACGSPHFDRPGTSVEAQAFALLALAVDRTSDQAA
jgi:unsaturated rhamnogalacturonyl hydrolase